MTGFVRVWDPTDPADCEAVSRLVGDYLVATEAEKGTFVDRADALPERYRVETDDAPRAFAHADVFVAHDSDAPVGCAVLSDPRDGASEIKRLWVDPVARGRGHAGQLIDAAVATAIARGDDAVRLTVWSWRQGAVALYRSRGFVEVPSWDARPDLVCMERPLATR
ncbi:GNAT family N-acetyltransferase [Demequina capsici]|uniref:GNAT family N-acetyltransferase n=1 Tax=Demequina capsici TaxID=3075620 RepID=A0AA96JCZ4_9MICO|nr:GNAT family N-acetyltransferase [Demequina sp. OYTSA14]WNM24149.1 GNAT family N-acetyltransferase [Demequina sp. OYTSA14]